LLRHELYYHQAGENPAYIHRIIRICHESV
jgi:hypothetical protein